MAGRATNVRPRVLFFLDATRRLRSDTVHSHGDAEIIGGRGSEQVGNSSHDRQLRRDDQFVAHYGRLARADGNARAGENAVTGSGPSHARQVEPVAGRRPDARLASTYFRALPIVDSAKVDTGFLDTRLPDGSSYAVDSVELRF